MNRIIDTAFYVCVTFLVGHCVSHKNNIDVAAFLAKIGDGGDVLVTYRTLIKH